MLQRISIFGFLLLSVVCDLHIPTYAQEKASVVSPAKTVTFRIRDEPETLDWNRAHTIVEAYILMNIMEGLITYDSNARVSPALAQSWKISPDGKTYTFKLRPGVKWSDGVPLKAQDFVYSWRRLLSPFTAASYAYLLFDVVGAEDFNQGKLKDFDQVGVKALDELTLEVKLAHSVAHWIYIPGFWVTFPMRKDVVESVGEGWEVPGRMVNLGPFSLASHDINSKIVMKANPLYYGERGNVNQAVAQIVKEDSSALALYEAGKIDVLTDLATVEMKSLKGRSDLKSFPQLKTGFLGFSTEKYPLSNSKFRRAIAMAIDKSKLSAILHGGQTAASSLVPPSLMGYSKSSGLPFNPAQARSELRTSGMDLGKPVTLDYMLPNWDKSVALANFIKSELKRNLNLEVILHPFDNINYRTQLDLRFYPLFDYSWTADYPDPDNFLSVFLSESGNSRTGWKNEKFDRMVKSARFSQDRKEREKLYLDLQKILLEDEAVIIPLYYEPNLALVRPRVKNFVLNPLDYLYLRKVNVIP